MGTPVRVGTPVSSPGCSPLTCAAPRPEGLTHVWRAPPCLTPQPPTPLSRFHGTTSPVPEGTGHLWDPAPAVPLPSAPSSQPGQLLRTLPRSRADRVPRQSPLRGSQRVRPSPVHTSDSCRPGDGVGRWPLAGDGTRRWSRLNGTRAPPAPSTLWGCKKPLSQQPRRTRVPSSPFTLLPHSAHSAVT